MAKDTRRGYLECPSCENGIGFYVCQEEPSSNICPFACSLLRQAQTTKAAASASHSKEASSPIQESHQNHFPKESLHSSHEDEAQPSNDESQSDHVARMPARHDDESDDDSITGASDALQTTETQDQEDMYDSKMPAVTQSQPDDDDDTVGESSTSGDEDHDDAQSETAASNQSNVISTPRRKRKSRSGESQDESSDVAVVTPHKKKRNVDALEKPAFEITQAERLALKDRPRWLDEFTGYLRNSLELSENNVKRSVDSINHLRMGHGVNYAPKSQEPVKFARGTKIDLSTNLQEVFEAAKVFENENRKDASHGWKVRHPITKLALFQEHVVKLTRAESSIENNE